MIKASGKMRSFARFREEITSILAQEQPLVSALNILIQGYFYAHACTGKIVADATCRRRGQ